MRDGADTWTAAKTVADADGPAGIGDAAALQGELSRALTYSLHLARGDQDPAVGWTPTVTSCCRLYPFYLSR